MIPILFLLSCATETPPCGDLACGEGQYCEILYDDCIHPGWGPGEDDDPEYTCRDTPDCDFFCDGWEKVDGLGFCTLFIACPAR